MSSPQPDKYSDPTLTEKDIKIFEDKRASYFKGSIAVAVVYGVVALSLILLAALTDAGRTVIFQNMKPFAITLAIGILVVITVMIIQLMSLKPTKIQTSTFDPQMCPDYWNLEETPESELTAMSEEQRMYLQTRCQKPDSLGLPTNTAVNYANVTNTHANYKLNESAREYLAGTGLSQTGAMDCKTIYPVALAMKDELGFPNEQNKLRCDIADKCGFAWSSVCP